MTLLHAASVLPAVPSRVVVAGASGSGKTTLAARIAMRLKVPHVELDGLHHGPGWTKRPSFEDDVAGFAAGPAWVTEWQYGDVRDLLVDRADLMVWLDLPRPIVMRQVVRRTLRRRLRREVLWNGNVEPPLWTFLTDRAHIVRWAWSSYPRTGERVLAAAARRPGLPVVRLTGHGDAARWLAGPLSAASPPAS